MSPGAWFSKPFSGLGFHPTRGFVLVLLGASLLCIACAPLMMPPGYSIKSHYISESAAQALAGAWLARLGFLLFGFGVWLLGQLRQKDWSAWVFWNLRVFAICLVATAAFSHKPWLSDVLFDPFEDFLHSLTATGMGFAFCLALVGMWFVARSPYRRALDSFVLLVAFCVPILGGLLPAWAGAAQRFMFASAYLWFGCECGSTKPGLHGD